MYHLECGNIRWGRLDNHLNQGKNTDVRFMFRYLPIANHGSPRTHLVRFDRITQYLEYVLRCSNLNFVLVFFVNRTPIFPELPLDVFLFVFHLQRGSDLE